MFDKILGGLIGAAAGDAMGAATEGRTTDQIKAYFDHMVTDFETTPQDTFGAGNVPGQVTDDFSSAYFIAKQAVNNGGNVTDSAAKQALIEWSGHAVFFDRFAGPTTRLAIQRFKDNTLKAPGGAPAVRQATNGAAMRIGPVALLSGGDVDRAIQDAVTVTMVTHDNNLALSGACAVAAAVSRAMRPDADPYNVIQASLYGAEQGDQIGRKIAKTVAGPWVSKRIEMAVDLGLGKGSPEDKMIEIRDRIGTGLHICETVPAAIGFLTANKGEAMGTIISAVNAGYDTDTVATVAGVIAGTLKGAQAFPAHYLDLLEGANGLPIEELARDIFSLAKERGQDCDAE